MISPTMAADFVSTLAPLVDGDNSLNVLRIFNDAFDYIAEMIGTGGLPSYCGRTPPSVHICDLAYVRDLLTQTFDIVYPALAARNGPVYNENKAKNMTFVSEFFDAASKTGVAGGGASQVFWTFLQNEYIAPATEKTALLGRLAANTGKFTTPD